MRPTLWLLVFACGLAGLTALRVRVWHSETSLWTDAVRHAPTKPRPWVNLGRAQQLDGNLDAANQSYHRAIALSFDPRRQKGANLYARLAAETDLGSLFLQQGNIPAAWNENTLVLNDRDWPLFPYAVFQRGLLEVLRGNCDLGKREWEAAVAAEGTLHMPPMPPTCQQK